MPDTIRFNSFKSGWCPSDDPVNGRKDGLLQMDNVELDQNGALVLSGGTTVIQAVYASNAHTLYSRVINGIRYDYAATADGHAFRNATTIITGGDGANAAFGTAFNFTLIADGTQRVKDSGTVIRNLGVGAPTAPMQFSSFFYNQTVPLSVATPNVIANVGTLTFLTNAIQMNVVATGAVNQCIIQSLPSTPFTPANWFQFTSAAGPMPSDVLEVVLDGFNPDFDTFDIQILLVAGDGAGNQVSDFYYYTVKSSDLVPYSREPNNFIVAIRRDQFGLQSPNGKSWNTVYGYRFVYTTISANPNIVVHNFINPAGGFQMAGSDIALDGLYEYAQMNVNNTGSYLAKSVLGPVSAPISANGYVVTLTYQVPTDPQVTEVWIFRRSREGTGLLDQWYRVAVVGLGGGPFGDGMSDLSALTLDITVNLNLVSIAAASITDKIYDILGPINGRWYYFTTNFMYPSDVNNPDLVDVSEAVRITGGASELFMWARQVSDTLVLVGTSIDIYALTGTFSTLPDFTVDIYYRPLHVAFPPITYDAAVRDGIVYYMSNDGWRKFSGATFYSNSSNELIVAPNTDRLYRGIPCQGYTAPNIQVLPGTVRFPVCVARNKLWCFITGTNRCEVYDFIRQYWRTFNLGLGDVTAAFATQDGNISAFYSSDKKLRFLDHQPTLLIDGSGNQSVSIESSFFDNGTPNQRKEPYTAKIRCGNTGLGILNFTINSDIGSVGGFIVPTGAVKEYTFDVSAGFQTLLPAIPKRFQFLINGSGISSLIFEDASLEFETRPVQLSFLRVQGENYGSTARKRLYTIPFQIDTLGNTVNMVPKVDGINQTPLSITSTRKQSFDYQFPMAAYDILLGVDYEFTFATVDPHGVFEFFGFNQPVNIEIFAKTALAHLVPPSNFGTASKKRLRVWPFFLCARNANVILTPIVDGTPIPGQAAIANFGDTRFTYLFQFTQDVFGVDYSMALSSTSGFELFGTLPPDIVQVLPIARHFDQVGPEELFKYGSIKQFELRVMPFCVNDPDVIPYIIYFNDNTQQVGNISVVRGVEASYFIGVPKGTAGQIVRFVLGPTAWDFHRFYIRLQVAKSGGDTERQWITLPDPGEGK